MGKTDHVLHGSSFTSIDVSPIWDEPSPSLFCADHDWAFSEILKRWIRISLHFFVLPYFFFFSFSYRLLR